MVLSLWYEMQAGAQLNWCMPRWQWPNENIETEWANSQYNTNKLNGQLKICKCKQVFKPKLKL